MKKISLVLSLFFCLKSIAQNDTTVKKLEAKLAAAKTVSLKLDIIKDLAEEYNMENPKACQDILDKGIFIAEESRDREMMIKARRIAGNIYSQMSALKEYSTKAMTYTQEALNISKQVNGALKEKVLCHMQMAKLHRNLQHNSEAKKFNEEALNTAYETNDDSLIVMAKISYGNTQIAAGEKLEAFKTYISAQAVAEKSKHNNKDWLEITAYNSLAYFYSTIEEYDKAIDYQYKSLEYAKKNGNHADMFGMMFSIGSNFSMAKKYAAAENIFTEEIRLADSLNMPDYKTQGQIGIVNNLVSGPEAEKSLQYLRQHPEIREMFNRINLSYQLDFGMGQVFAIVKQYDSARYYFGKSVPFYEKYTSIATLPFTYLQYAKFLYTSGNYPSAISYLSKATLINDSLKNSAGNKDIYQLLDSCYQKTGDYKNAFLYSSLFQKAKAEADEKNKAKDILAVEIDAENKRKERLDAAEAEATIRRHNWQYMGIVMSIISLFILLATVGIFNVPLKWVRALGFIAFIFLFEFIILLADTWIHHATHGEPWKVLGIKVVLIALLLPLHHFLEHKAIAYITHRRNKKTAQPEFAAALQTKPLHISGKKEE